WFDCASKVLYNLEHVVAFLFLENNFEAYVNDSKEVKSLVEHYHDDLIKTFNHSSWMDESTRLEAVKKVKTMKSIVGFTPQFMDEITLEAAYYHFPEMSETDHFANMIYATRYYSELQFSNYNRPPDSRRR
ncbi:Endothelin-converting enzyme 2, partial [Armadillidium nasatum]